MNVVFDTYAWIEFFRGTEKGKVARRYLNQGEIITPVIVLLELSYKADKEGWDFKKYVNFIKFNSEIKGIDEDFVLTFGSLYNKSKKKVRGIGFADIIILNTAVLNNAKVLTGDKHFSKFKESIVL